MNDRSVTVDRELCIGSGMCVVYAEHTFVHDDEAKAVVLEGSSDPIDAIRVAVEACPVSALQLVTDEQGA